MATHSSILVGKSHGQKSWAGYSFVGSQRAPGALLNMTTNLTVLDKIHLLAHISVGQDFRHGLAGSSAQGLSRLKSRYELGCILIWSLDWEESTPKITHIVGKIISLGCRTELPNFLLNVSQRPILVPRAPTPAQISLPRLVHQLS